MSNKPQQVSDAELAILKLLWEVESLTSREIREELYPKGTQSDYATVQKLLERLEKKRFISRDRKSFPHIFRATVSKEAHLGQQIQALAEKLTEGSMVPFVMHLVERKQLSPRERKEIRELLRGHKSARKTGD